MTKGTIIAIIRYLYFYNVPTLLYCRDQAGASYFFVLYDEEKMLYFGTPASAEDAQLFLEGKTDLRSLFEKSDSGYYLVSPNGKNTMIVDRKIQQASEEYMPESGLRILSPAVPIIIKERESFLKG